MIMRGKLVYGYPHVSASPLYQDVSLHNHNCVVSWTTSSSYLVLQDMNMLLLSNVSIVQPMFLHFFW